MHSLIPRVVQADAEGRAGQQEAQADGPAEADKGASSTPEAAKAPPPSPPRSKRKRALKLPDPNFKGEQLPMKYEDPTCKMGR